MILLPVRHMRGIAPRRRSRLLGRIPEEHRSQHLHVVGQAQDSVQLGAVMDGGLPKAAKTERMALEQHVHDGRRRALNMGKAALGEPRVVADEDQHRRLSSERHGIFELLPRRLIGDNHEIPQLHVARGRRPERRFEELVDEFFPHRPVRQPTPNRAPGADGIADAHRRPIDPRGSLRCHGFDCGTHRGNPSFTWMTGQNRRI